MASQQLIEIIIKAVDEASSTAEKVDNSLKKIGENTKSLGNTPALMVSETNYQVLLLLLMGNSEEH